MFFVRVLRCFSKKKKLNEEDMKLGGQSNNKQTMWASNDKDVLFVQQHEAKSEDANLQVKEWWSSLLMEMLLKVALQCAACALQGSFDEDFDADFSRDSLQDEDFFWFWTPQGLEAIYGYIFWFRLCEPLFFDPMGWNASTQLVDWMEQIWPFDPGGHGQDFAITA